LPLPELEALLALFESPETGVLDEVSVVLLGVTAGVDAVVELEGAVALELLVLEAFC
jgi:hypothetical protein